MSYELDKEITVLTNKTIEVLLDQNTDSLALYIFYIKTAKRQKTNQIKALDTFCVGGLNRLSKSKWGRTRLLKAKQVLIDFNLVEYIQKKSKSGKFAEAYVKVNYLWKQENVNRMYDLPQTVPPSDGERQQMLKVTELNALSNLNIGEPILETEDLPLPKRITDKFGNPDKNITKTYQEQAFRFAENLKIDLEKASKTDKTIKGRWIGAFKQGANVNGAYSKCYDSEEFNRRDDLGKIFYFFKVL